MSIFQTKRRLPFQLQLDCLREPVLHIANHDTAIFPFLRCFVLSWGLGRVLRGGLIHILTGMMIHITKGLMILLMI